MAVLRPRTRLVYFRVSEDEYEKLHALCHQVGARSLSDLVRKSLLEDTDSHGCRQDDVVALVERIDRLLRVIEELREKFEQTALISRDLT